MAGSEPDLLAGDFHIRGGIPDRLPRQNDEPLQIFGRNNAFAAKPSGGVLGALAHLQVNGPKRSFGVFCGLQGGEHLGIAIENKRLAQDRLLVLVDGDPSIVRRRNFEVARCGYPVVFGVRIDRDLAVSLEFDGLFVNLPLLGVGARRVPPDLSLGTHRKGHNTLARDELTFVRDRQLV